MQLPDMSRRTVIAGVLVVAGVVALVLALLGGGSGSSPSDAAKGGGSSSDTNKGLDPLPALSEDEEAKLNDDKQGPLAGKNDPFAVSFGASVPHKVTIRASANGALRAAWRYRDGHDGDKIVSESFSTSRTVTGAFPVAQVGVRIAPNANRGSCTIIIDGVEVVRHTTNKQFGVIVCTA